ncbi:hypothetical protein STEG23_023344 [Scotinomys teguina]
MKFAGKWKELENIILSEVTQTQKDKHVVFLSKGNRHICEYLMNRNNTSEAKNISQKNNSVLVADRSAKGRHGGCDWKEG